MEYNYKQINALNYYVMLHLEVTLIGGKQSK